MQKLAKWLLSKPFLIAVAVILTYTVVGFFLVPYLIKRSANRFFTKTLQCQVTVEAVRVNPYALSLDVRKFDMKESDGSPLFSFEQFFVNFELSSLWRWAWTFADVRLEGPSIHLERRPDGRINLVDLIGRLSKSEESKDIPDSQEEEPPPRLIFEHIALHQGKFMFSDRSDPTHATVTLEPLGIELMDFTTLRDKKGMHSFEATLPQGGKLRWSGEISLYPLWTEGSLEVKGLKPVTPWRFLQDELLLDEPGGSVDAAARYRFNYAENAPDLVVEGIRVLVSGLSLRARGGEAPVLSLETILLNEGRFDLGAREFAVEELAIARGSLEAHVDEQGQLNWQKLMAAKPGPQSSGSRSEAEEGRSWRITLKALNLDDLAVKFSDHSRAHPLKMDVSKLGMRLSGSVSVGPRKVQGVAENMRGNFSVVSLTEIGRERPLVGLDTLTLEGGRLDLEARRFILDRVRVDGGHANAYREKDGTLNLVRLFGGSDEGTLKKELAEAGAEAEAEGHPWTVGVDALEVAGFGLAFADQSVSPATEVNLENIALSLADIQSDGKRPIPFDVSLAVKQGGRFSAKGRFDSAQKRAEARIEVSNLALTPLQPYLAQFAQLTLDSGDFSISGQSTYSAGKAGANLTFNGNAQILNLLVSEHQTGQQFLAWKALKANDLKLSLMPNRLEIGEVRLSEPYGKLIVYEDQSVNLKKVLLSQGSEPKEVKPPPSAGTQEIFPVHVRRIRVEKGRLDFADLSLRPQFATRIHELKGTVVGLSNKEGERGQVQLDGRVNEYGVSKIQGQLEPLNAKRFTDIAMIFRNMELTNLTPYSAKFAGYELASGKLSLDLRYVINNSALKGDNQIILDKLTLGEKIKSPGAPNIPLELALALLKDSNGRIDIGVPVSGNLDDPQFRYGPLIWKAILNLFTKIVTAPFKALGAMFGLERDDLGSIAFEPGKAVVPPPEREKLLSLADALAKRPQLTVKVQGRYDPVADGKILKAVAVRRELARRTGVSVSPDEDPGPVDPGSPSVQNAIEAMVRERISTVALDEAKEKALKGLAEAAMKTGKPEKREDETPTSALPPELSRELYTSLVKRLVKEEPMTEKTLKQLGLDRAEAVKNEVLAAGTVDAGRLDIIEPSTAKGTGKTVNTELTLAVSR